MLAIDLPHQLTSEEVLKRLNVLCVRRGMPDFIYSDNDSEFSARKVGYGLARD